MVRAFRPDSHLLQGQTDFSSDVFSLVFRCNVHIPGMIIWNLGRFTMVIQLEEIKLLFCAKEELKTFFGSFFNGLLQNHTGIIFKRSTIWVCNVTEHPHHTAFFWSPGQRHEGVRFWVEKQIRVGFITKSVNRRCINGNAISEGFWKLIGHNGYIFLFSKYVTEGQTDKLHILFLDILNNFLLGIFHSVTSFLLICYIHLFIWIFAVWCNQGKRRGEYGFQVIVEVLTILL